MFDLPVLANLVNSIPDSPALCKFPFARPRDPTILDAAAWRLVDTRPSADRRSPRPGRHGRGAGCTPVDHAALNATLFIGPRTRTSARLEGLRVEATIEQEARVPGPTCKPGFACRTPGQRVAPGRSSARADTTPAAHAVTLTVGGVPQPLIAQGATNHWRWQTTLPGNGRLEPLLSYRVPLGDGPWRFRYDLVNGWRRAPGSLRVTLRFPDGLAADQLLLAPRRVHLRWSPTHLEFRQPNSGRVTGTVDTAIGGLAHHPGGTGRGYVGNRLGRGSPRPGPLVSPPGTGR
ncbi:MAG: hypothetical protein HZY76_05420 [Anaerolineae bacterium]|nr:MAG: hypothetical protein HZY76_05420 [Anaerolineae bacterium]